MATLITNFFFFSLFFFTLESVKERRKPKGRRKYGEERVSVGFGGGRRSRCGHSTRTHVRQSAWGQRVDEWESGARALALDEAARTATDRQKRWKAELGRSESWLSRSHEAAPSTSTRLASRPSLSASFLSLFLSVSRRLFSLSSPTWRKETPRACRVFIIKRLHRPKCPQGTLLPFFLSVDRLFPIFLSSRPVLLSS